MRCGRLWHAATGRRARPGHDRRGGRDREDRAGRASLAAEAEADGATVLRTRCYETERSLFLQPVVEAIMPVVSRTPAATLRELLGEHAPAAAALLPEAAALLGPSPAWRGSVEMERRRAFEAVTALLRGLAARSPVLLVVDDLQYAGQSTVELLHYLGRHAPGARLLAVATVRAENDAQIGAALAPVATPDRARPAGPRTRSAAGPRGGPGRAGRHILRRTRGHTLFVVEVAARAGRRRRRRARIAAQRRAGPGAAGPAPAAETLLRAAAVLGATVDPLALAAAARPDARGRAGAVRAGAGRAAARGQRPRLRVRQRPHPGGRSTRARPNRPGWPTTAGPPTC